MMKKKLNITAPILKLSSIIHKTNDKHIDKDSLESSKKGRVANIYDIRTELLVKRLKNEILEQLLNTTVKSN